MYKRHFHDMAYIMQSTYYSSIAALNRYGHGGGCCRGHVNDESIYASKNKPTTSQHSIPTENSLTYEHNERFATVFTTEGLHYCMARSVCNLQSTGYFI